MYFFEVDIFLECFFVVCDVFVVDDFDTGRHPAAETGLDREESACFFHDFAGKSLLENGEIDVKNNAGYIECDGFFPRFRGKVCFLSEPCEK